MNIKKWGMGSYAAVDCDVLLVLLLIAGYILCASLMDYLWCLPACAQGFTTNFILRLEA